MSFFNYAGKVLLNIQSLDYNDNIKLIDKMLKDLK